MEELIRIQSALKAPKGQYNSFGKYKYRSAEDILEAVKPLLAENNCSLTLSDDIQVLGTPVVVLMPGGAQTVTGQRIYVRATATLTNKDGKQVVVTACAREEETKKGMDGSQVTGASSSYARKYALNGMFAIDDTKDSDTTNTHGKDAAGKAVDPTAEALEAVRGCSDVSKLNDLWRYYAEKAPQLTTQGSKFYEAWVERKKALQATAK